MSVPLILFVIAVVVLASAETSSSSSGSSENLADVLLEIINCFGCLLLLNSLFGGLLVLLAFLALRGLFAGLSGLHSSGLHSLYSLGAHNSISFAEASLDSAFLGVSEDGVFAGSAARDLFPYPIVSVAIENLSIALADASGTLAMLFSALCSVSVDLGLGPGLADGPRCRVFGPLSLRGFSLRGLSSPSGLRSGLDVNLVGSDVNLPDVENGSGNSSVLSSCFSERIGHLVKEELLLEVVGASLFADGVDHSHEPLVSVPFSLSEHLSLSSGHFSGLGGFSSLVVVQNRGNSVRAVYHDLRGNSVRAVYHDNRDLGGGICEGYKA